MKKRVDLAVGISFVIGLGTLIPSSGCLSGNDEFEGRICASPAEGGTYCVDSSDGPGGAWNEAMAHGAEPIEMWAVWPKKYELRDVVSDRYLLKAWLDDVRDVLDYVRATQGNAESYQVTMEGKLGDDLDRVKLVQSGVLWDKRVDPQKEISALAQQKAAEEIDPAKALVAVEKQVFGELQKVVDLARVNGVPFATQFKTSWMILSRIARQKRHTGLAEVVFA